MGLEVVQREGTWPCHWAVAPQHKPTPSRPPPARVTHKTKPSAGIMESSYGPSAGGTFGAVHVIEPRSEHTHTAIMLHGRGSNGPEFAEELAETAAPGQQPLTQRFPGWRWVFPSSQELWSTAFQEMLPAWFEAHSLADTTVRENLQMAGIRQSVNYIQGILDREIETLGGETEKVVIMGLSQGGAIGMWTLLCQKNLGRQFGAFVGASTWLPFAANIEILLGKETSPKEVKVGAEITPSDAFVGDMMSAWSRCPPAQLAGKSLLSTPVLLGHGVDDGMVEVGLGRQAQQVLARIGFQTEWKEYLGAELEGHWLKTPEQIDDIAAFMMEVTTMRADTAV